MCVTSNISEEQLIKHHEKPEQYGITKVNDSSPETKLKIKQYCNLTDRIQNSCPKEIQQATRKLRKVVR